MRKRIWDLLEEWGKRAWVVILLLTTTSVCIGLLTYCSQRATNRPELAFALGNIYWDDPSSVRAQFNFANTGKKTARRGTATLFAANNPSSVKLGAAPTRSPRLSSGPLSKPHSRAWLHT